MATSITIDLENLPEPIVNAAARAMAGMSWITHGVDRRWDEVEQKERDYWKGFAKAGLLGAALEAHRTEKSVKNGERT